MKFSHCLNVKLGKHFDFIFSYVDVVETVAKKWKWQVKDEFNNCYFNYLAYSRTMYTHSLSLACIVVVVDVVVVTCNSTNVKYCLKEQFFCLQLKESGKPGSLVMWALSHSLSLQLAEDLHSIRVKTQPTLKTKTNKFNERSPWEKLSRKLRKNNSIFLIKQKLSK